jgi:hypothetical protein
MAFIQGHPGGVVVCEDPGDSLEPLGLTVSIGIITRAYSIDLLWQTRILLLNAEPVVHFILLFHSTPLEFVPNEATCRSIQDPQVPTHLLSNLWMPLPLIVSCLPRVQLEVDWQTQFDLQDETPERTMNIPYHFSMIFFYQSYCKLANPMK